MAAVLAKHRKATLDAGRIGSLLFHDTDGGYLCQSNLLKRYCNPILAGRGYLRWLLHVAATIAEMLHRQDDWHTPVEGPHAVAAVSERALRLRSPK